MCWSGGISLAIGSAGIASAAYGEKRGVARSITIPLIYFSLMEFLQFAGYLYVNQCALSGNGLVTQLSYLHIAIQPFFVNMFFLTFVAAQKRKKIAPFVYAGAALSSVLLLIKLVPFDPQHLCTLGQTLCAPNWCTITGNWHIGWNVPLYDWPLPGDGMWYYGFGAFLVPILYGEWRGALTLFLLGPVLAYFLSNGNPHEWPAVWCLYSVLLVLFTLRPIFASDKLSPTDQKRLFTPER